MEKTKIKKTTVYFTTQFWSIKNCTSEIKYPNILYTQNPWLTLTKGGNTFHEKQIVGLVKRVTCLAESPS